MLTLTGDVEISDADSNLHHPSTADELKTWRTERFHVVGGRQIAVYLQ